MKNFLTWLKMIPFWPLIVIGVISGLAWKAIGEGFKAGCFGFKHTETEYAKAFIWKERNQ